PGPAQPAQADATTTPGHPSTAHFIYGRAAAPPDPASFPTRRTSDLPDTNALAANAAVSDNFTVYVKDGSTGTASTAVNFAITGTNDNPTVTANAQSVQLVEAGVGTPGTASATIALAKADPAHGDAAG